VKEGELREILDQSGLDPTRSSGSVNVLVDLRVPKPDQSLIADLERVGLVVDRIVGRTILGSIDAAKMSELQRNEHVREVEPSRTLRYHAPMDQ